MPRIHLKPHSAEFADEGDKKNHARACDMPGCAASGQHKAPKNRALNDHYLFCLEHVQEYNKAWDYFSGMSQKDIEDHIVRSALWDRPTRRYDTMAQAEEALYRKAWQSYNYTEKEPPRAQTQQGQRAGIDHNSPEFQAMIIMGLSPPLDFPMIKNRYRELAKKHHPDVNPGDPQSEDLLKSINMAYTILKIAFEKYDRLADPAAKD